MNYKLEEFFEKNAFVPDFSDTDFTHELLKIVDEPGVDWYDDYWSELKDFAKGKRLTQFSYENGKHSEIFFSSDIEYVIDFILENFYTEDGGYLDRDDVINDIKVKEPLPTIPEIMKLLNLRIIDLNLKFEIPYRTVQDWSANKSNPPEYVLKLIIRALVRDYHYKQLKDLDNYYS